MECALENNVGVVFLIVQIGGVCLELRIPSMHLRFLWENVSTNFFSNNIWFP